MTPCGATGPDDLEQYSMISPIFKIRPHSSLPFYCNPVILFIFVWLLMLGSLRFEITEVSYPDFSLPVLIFAASLFSFLLGYYIVRIILWKQINSCAFAKYQIDIIRLRRFNILLACAASALMAYNYLASGLPPFFAFLGFSAKSVYGYGKLMQLMLPLQMAVFVNAFLDSSIKRRILYASFGFLTMLLYLARGAMLLVLFQALVVLSIRSSLSKKRIYLVALAGVVAAGVCFGIVGSYRTSDVILFAGMQIKAEYQQWPTIFVWIISYVSAALSNLCWFVDTAHFDHLTWTFAYQLLPSFWNPLNPHTAIMQSSRIVDGTSTYLANYFLDFSYFGIFFINLSIGILSGIGSIANRISRKFLVWSVFLSCISFMFFWDFFTELSTVVLFTIQGLAQWYFIRERTSQTHNPTIKGPQE
jgi:oligosaccharide repeat unit polymerase